MVITAPETDRRLRRVRPVARPRTGRHPGVLERPRHAVARRRGEDHEPQPRSGAARPADPRDARVRRAAVRAASTSGRACSTWATRSCRPRRASTSRRTPCDGCRRASASRCRPASTTTATWSTWRAPRPRRSCPSGSGSGGACRRSAPRRAGCCCRRCLPSKLDAYFAMYPREKISPVTVTDEQALRDIIAQVREQGWSLNDREVDLGARSIAAPIVGADGRLRQRREHLRLDLARLRGAADVGPPPAAAQRDRQDQRGPRDDPAPRHLIPPGTPVRRRRAGRPARPFPTERETPRGTSRLPSVQPHHRERADHPAPPLGGADVPVLVGRRDAGRVAPRAPRILRHRPGRA